MSRQSWRRVERSSELLDQRPAAQRPFGSPQQPASPGNAAVLRTAVGAGEHTTMPFGSPPQPASPGAVAAGAGEHLRPSRSPPHPAALQTATRLLQSQSSERPRVTEEDEWSALRAEGPCDAGEARSGVPEAARLRRRKNAARRGMRAPFWGRRLRCDRPGRAGAPVDLVFSILEKLNPKGHRA